MKSSQNLRGNPTILSLIIAFSVRECRPPAYPCSSETPRGARVGHDYSPCVGLMSGDVCEPRCTIAQGSHPADRAVDAAARLEQAQEEDDAAASEATRLEAEAVAAANTVTQRVSAQAAADAAAVDPAEKAEQARTTANNKVASATSAAQAVTRTTQALTAAESRLARALALTQSDEEEIKAAAATEVVYATAAIAAADELKRQAVATGVAANQAKTAAVAEATRLEALAATATSAAATAKEDREAAEAAAEAATQAATQARSVATTATEDAAAAEAAKLEAEGQSPMSRIQSSPSFQLRCDSKGNWVALAPTCAYPCTDNPQETISGEGGSGVRQRLTEGHDFTPCHGKRSGDVCEPLCEAGFERIETSPSFRLRCDSAGPRLRLGRAIVRERNERFL